MDDQLGTEKPDGQPMTPQPIRPQLSEIQLRRSSLSPNGVSSSIRSRRNKFQDKGLYNSELPSPRPNVLLPNFSISSYEKRDLYCDCASTK